MGTHGRAEILIATMSDDLSDSPAVAAALRRGRRTIDATRDRLADGLMSNAGSGRAGSDSTYRSQARICLDGFREGAEGAATLLAELKQRRATNRADELASGLQELARQFLGLFDEHDTSGSLYPKPLEVRAELERQLAGAIDDVIADLHAGVHHLAQSGSRSSSTSITFRGNATGVTIATDGSIVTVSGNQSVSTGLSVDDLLAAVEAIRKAIVASDLGDDEKDIAEDALVNAERELMSPAPDAGRLHRFLSKAGEWGSRIGQSTAGGVLSTFIARYLESL